MTETTPPTTAPTAAALEAMLEMARERLRARVTDATAVDPATDPDGHARDSADRFAIRFLKAAARVGTAIGKASATKTINIVVTRPELGPPAREIPVVKATAKMEEYSRRMYQAFMKTDALRRELIESGGQRPVAPTEPRSGQIAPLSELQNRDDGKGVAEEGEGDAVSGGSNGGNAQ